MDAVSRPLRNAFQRWAFTCGHGYFGGWNKDRCVWHYEVYRVDLVVEVWEDGSEATVRASGKMSRARTPRGLVRILARESATLSPTTSTPPPTTPTTPTTPSTSTTPS